MKIMKDYDEFQRFWRYKYGHNALFILIGMLALNVSFFIEDFNWAASPEIELWILLFISIIYFSVMTNFRGANEHTIEKNKMMHFTLIALSFVMFYIVYIGYQEGPTYLMKNGKLESGFIHLLLGISFLSDSVASYAGRLYENWKERKARE